MYSFERTIVIASVLFVAWGCATKSLQPSGQSRQPAPDFTLPTLDGRQVQLWSLRGKVVVLDFWASWCPPCREGLPHLQALAANGELKQRGLAVLAVNEEEKLATIRAFLERNHDTFDVLRDIDGTVARAYSASALPTTIVIGRDGLVLAVISGWTQDTSHQIDEAVSRALDAPVQ